MYVDLHLFHLYLYQGSLGVEMGLPWFIHMLLLGYGKGCFFVSGVQGTDSLSSFAVAAAAAKSLQLYLTLCDPIDGSPPGSTVPGFLQAGTLEWVAISFSAFCRLSDIICVSEVVDISPGNLDTTLMEESQEELKNLLMRVKEESEKTGLKLNI